MCFFRAAKFSPRARAVALERELVGALNDCEAAERVSGARARARALSRPPFVASLRRVVGGRWAAVAVARQPAFAPAAGASL